MVIDCHNHIGVELQMYLRGDFPYGQSLEALTREGSALGVTHWIIFPMVTHLALNIDEMRTGNIEPEGALERVPYIFENRRMLCEIYEMFPDEGAMTLPFVMFDPAREPVAQAAELRKLKVQYPFYGLKTQTTMLQSPIKSLEGGGRVFLELAEEWNLPLLIHSSVLPSDVWAQASDIIDIAAANPRVRFCVAHSCRFDRVQLDRIAELPNAWFDCSAHGIHCDLATTDSAIVAPLERRFDADYTRPGQVLHALAEAYPTKLLWGSDSPYYSFVSQVDGERIALLSSYAAEADYLNDVPESLRQRISHTNTLEFLQLPAIQLV